MLWNIPLAMGGHTKQRMYAHWPHTEAEQRCPQLPAQNKKHMATSMPRAALGSGCHHRVLLLSPACDTVCPDKGHRQNPTLTTTGGLLGAECCNALGAAQGSGTAWPFPSCPQRRGMLTVELGEHRLQGDCRARQGRLRFQAGGRAGTHREQVLCAGSPSSLYPISPLSPPAGTRSCSRAPTVAPSSFYRALPMQREQ